MRENEGNLKDISQDIILTRWARSLKRPNTKNTYVTNMLVFCRYLNSSPLLLKEEAKAEQIQNVFKGDRKIRDYFEDFNYYLSEQGLSPNTIHSYFNALKSFYRFYDIDIPNVKLDAAVLKKCNLGIPTREDIQDALKVADPLETALILVGVSSGLAANELINLQVRDLQFCDLDNITTVKVRRIKTNVDYYTFLTPEATSAVRNYIKFRNRTSNDPRKNQALIKQKVYTDTDFLFCIRKVPDEFMETKNEKIRQFGVAGIMSIYRDISEKISKSTGKGDFNLVRSHTMRKYFDSALLNAGCDFFHVEYFMGHKLPATQSHYFSVNVQKLKELFTKFVPYLTIQSRLDVLMSQEFKDVVEERDQYKSLAHEYYLDSLKLIQMQIEGFQSKRKISHMTEEEKEKDFREEIVNKVPSDENEARWLEELKKILKI